MQQSRFVALGASFSSSAKLTDFNPFLFAPKVAAAAAAAAATGDLFAAASRLILHHRFLLPLLKLFNKKS